MIIITLGSYTDELMCVAEYGHLIAGCENIFKIFIHSSFIQFVFDCDQNHGKDCQR